MWNHQDHRGIVATEDQVKRAAARLKKQWEFMEPSVELPLARAQELIAKALGWRNFDEALKALRSKESQPGAEGLTAGPNPLLAKCANVEQAFHAILALSPAGDGSSSMWRGRMQSMLHAALGAIGISTLSKLRARELAAMMSLDHLVELAKRDPIEMKDRNPMLGYLRSLPGMNPELKKPFGVVCEEQHGYLVMQLEEAWRGLEALESRDPMLIPKEGPQSCAERLRRSVGKEWLERVWELSDQQEPLRVSDVALCVIRCLNVRMREDLSEQLRMILSASQIVEALGKS